MEKESMDERWKNARVDDLNEREKKGILCICMEFLLLNVSHFRCWLQNMYI